MALSGVFQSAAIEFRAPSCIRGMRFAPVTRYKWIALPQTDLQILFRWTFNFLSPRLPSITNRLLKHSKWRPLRWKRDLTGWKSVLPW